MKNDFTITPLKGPDRIRLRPLVVFGDDGREGATAAVRMILDIFLTEAELGFCERLFLKLEQDDTVVIESRDRGFLLDETEQDGKPSWYYDFCEFGVGPREPDEGYYYTVGRKYGAFYGVENGEMPPFKAKGDPAFDLCCVQYASAWMKVESVHENMRKSLRFEKGYPVGKMERERVSEPSFTKISFRLDQEVFRDVSVSFDAIADYFSKAASSLNGFACLISREEKTAEFFRAPKEV